MVDKRDQLTRELGTDVAQPHRRLAIRRAKLIIAAVCVTIAAGLVWFTVSVIRGVPTNACKAALGPLDELEQLTHLTLRIDEGVGGDRECDIAVWDAAVPPSVRSGDAALDTAHDAVVVLSQRHASRRADLDEQVARDVFEEVEKLDVNGVEVMFHVAGPASRQHALVFTRGATATRVRLSRKVFDVARAKAYAKTVTR